MRSLNAIILSLLVCLCAQQTLAADIVEETEAYVRDAAHTYVQKTRYIQHCLHSAQSGIETKQCMALSVDVESDEMNRVYEEAEKKLRTVIEKEPDRYLVETLLELHTSQQFFTASLHAFCSFESVRSIGGTGNFLEYLGCKEDKTRSRTKDIKYYVLDGL